MNKIKSQNVFHATINGKKTICGLSNQFNIADSLSKFSERVKNSQYVKYCCKKCQTVIK